MRSERMVVQAARLAFLGVLFAAVGFAARAQAGPIAGPAADSFPLATDVRLGGDEAQTRFVMDLSRKIDLHVFTLADPYRVIVDIPQTSFRLRPKTGETGRGLIKAFRFGLVMPGGSRIVIDLTRPVRIDKAVVLGAANDQPARLVLDLTPIDREAFMRLAALEAPGSENRKPDWQQESKPGDPRPLIVIDPGHGGIDNGTRAASGEMEKTIVLEFCLTLRDKIEKVGKYRVVMTRTEDNFVPLGDRVALA